MANEKEQAREVLRFGNEVREMARRKIPKKQDAAAFLAAFDDFLTELAGMAAGESSFHPLLLALRKAWLELLGDLLSAFPDRRKERGNR